MTEWLNFHFSLLCIGEGNGNPLQCSCLENPRDRRACWAAVYGVAKGWTQLMWLSSSSRSSSFSYSIQQQTISCLDWDAQWKEDFIWQPAMISSVAELRRSSKALPKAKLSPKKKSHGHCLVICCQSDPLQLSESWRNHYIWEVCSTNRWDVPKTVMPAAGIGQQKRPSSFPQHLTAHHTTNASKVELIGLQSFASCVTFTWPLPNRLPPLQASRQLFVGKTPPQAAGGRRCFARDHWIPKHGYLLYRNKLISHWQKMVPILINKDVLWA